MITACLAGILKEGFITLKSAETLIPYRFCDWLGTDYLLHGYEAFTDATKLALDWSTGNAANATSMGIVSNQYQIDGNTGRFFFNAQEDAAYLELDTAITGDFDVNCYVSLGVDSTGANATLMAYASSGEWIASDLRGGNSQGFRQLKTTSGSTTATATNVYATSGYLRIKRVGTTITTYYSTNGTSWTQIASETFALGTVSVRLTCGNITGSDVTFTFDDVTFTDGCPVDAQFKCVTSGEEYVDAGDGFKISKGDISAVTDGTLTVKEDINNTGTFDAYGTDSAWNNEDVAGNYPHTSSTGRYWWPLITMEGDGATFESLTYAKY